MEILIVALFSAVPIMLASYGEMVLERSGRVNLGVDGLMALGASVAVIAASASSVHLGLLASALAGAIVSLIYAIPVIYLRTDQIVTGLLLGFIAMGLADLLPGSRLSPSIETGSPAHLMLVALSLALPPALWIFLEKTWLGTELRAIGYDEASAKQRGMRVEQIRLFAALFGGALAALGGAYMSLVIYNGKYFTGITGGWGWLALGAVILGYWRPLGVAIASYSVGAVLVMRPYIEGLAPGPLASTAPYIAIIIALALASILSRRIGVRPPRTL